MSDSVDETLDSVYNFFEDYIQILASNFKYPVLWDELLLKKTVQRVSYR